MREFECISKSILTHIKGIAEGKSAVACCRHIKRRWICAPAAVVPATTFFNKQGSAAMRKIAVLHTAAIKVLIWLATQGLHGFITI